MALDGGEVDERLGVAQVSGSGHRQQQVVVEGDGTGGGGVPLSVFPLPVSPLSVFLDFP